MTSSDPTRVKYSGRDFDTLFDDLSFRLRDRYGDDYSDFATSSMGVILMDIMAYALDQLSWYQDRRATEAFLDTAIKRSSVSRLTRPLGYQMRPATSSTTYVTVTPDEALPFEWKVYRGFKFSGPEGLVFESLEDVYWSADSTAPKDVLVREGQTKTTTVTSDGSENIEVRLAGASQEGAYVVSGSVVVVVDGSYWTEVDFLEFESANTFEVHYHEEPPVVRFGNGIAGNVPADGAEIRVSYVVNHGARGNVASNTIDDVVQPLVIRFTDIPIMVTNASGSTGGADPESLEEAKAKAPKFFATRGVAVTAQDYESLSVAFTDPQYGAVASANAFVAREMSSDVIGDGFIAHIEETVDGYQSTIAAGMGGISSAFTEIDSDAASSQEQLVLVDGGLTVIDVQVAAGLDAVTLVETDDLLGRIQSNAQKMLGTHASSFDYDITDLITLLGNIVTEATSSYKIAAGAAKTSLESEWSPAISSQEASASTYQSTVQGAAGTLRTSIQAISVQSGLVSDSADAVDGFIAGIRSSVTSGESDVSTVSVEVALHSSEISDDLASLREHYGSFLSSDCKANLITVPILTYDSDEFYAAPNNGLKARLEDYLQARCDVAHSVRVVDGSTALVAADVTIQVKILESAIFSEVSSDIEAEVRVLLKKRRFGDDLFLSEVYEIIDAVDGVDYFDVSIETSDGDGGDNDVDSRGNLVVDDKHVITMGTISVTEKD